MKIFSTSSNKELANKVAKAAKMAVGKASIKSFADGELCVRVPATASRQNIVFGSTQQPDSNLLELIWLASAFKKPTIIAPYLGYMRQDRAFPSGSVVAAKIVADLISSRASKIITLDIHGPKAMAHFGPKLKNLTALPILADEIKKYDDNAVIVAPDLGARKRSKTLAKMCDGLPTAVITKTRPSAGRAVAKSIKGNVAGKNIILIDDMIDTGGTLIAAARLLKKKGAKKIIAAATHGIFSKNALTRLKVAGIENIIVTDTIPQNNRPKYLKVVSIAEVIAEELR
ncbi:MAG: ribose-phosphate diphosphokinase [bacterium]